MQDAYASNGDLQTAIIAITVQNKQTAIASHVNYCKSFIQHGLVSSKLLMFPCWVHKHEHINTECNIFFHTEVAFSLRCSISWHDTMSLSAVEPRDHFIRMHRIGEPSHPISLRGKQCNMYIPAFTWSSFRPSIGIMSWEKQSNQRFKCIKLLDDSPFLRMM